MSFTLPAPAWPDTLEEAVKIQTALRNHIRLKNDFKSLSVIAGVDVSYDIKNNITRAFIVLMNLDELKPFASVTAQKPTSFPYIPGFLSFREAPAVLDALDLLPQKPDLLMVDGQGIAHPRRLGIAAHLGALTDMPSVGVAKSRLTGKYQEPGPEKGDHSDLTDKDEKIGVVLRSKVNTNPLFISPGHKIDFDTSLKLVMQCLTRYRLPEPTRIADKLSKLPGNGNLL